MNKNIVFRISFIISLIIHLILGILIYLLMDKYKSSENVEEKKVKLAFKRGGDSAKEDSKFKENTSLPKSPPQQPAQPKQQTIKQQAQEPNQHKAQPKNTTNIDKQIDLSKLQVYSQNDVQDSNIPPQNQTSQSNITQMLQNLPQDTREEIIDLYGDELGDYGEAERDFIINNLREIGRITQYHLNLRGYPPDAGYLGQQGKNAVEFYLYPNGDISDLKIILDSKSMILDKNTIKTIQIAYKDYPHPTTKTKIKIYVKYYLFYY
ncbi:hypothetical protein CCY99_08305 [Helicobacter sp. 16-1353]|uniref:TonB family protein n=1 Tax=Helicobacter sp. 16-1353 TaxID=2004996 RepID=UPI000DCBB991|nr:TonB family protein [Helicobacter sp. 16-1353]RAX51792.1 hypothetical protein CCY99_08305 [Helicobacter sp. 16-1353]